MLASRISSFLDVCTQTFSYPSVDLALFVQGGLCERRGGEAWVANTEEGRWSQSRRGEERIETREERGVKRSSEGEFGWRESISRLRTHPLSLIHPHGVFSSLSLPFLF